MIVQSAHPREKPKEANDCRSCPADGTCFVRTVNLSEHSADDGIYCFIFGKPPGHQRLHLFLVRAAYRRFMRQFRSIVNYNQSGNGAGTSLFAFDDLYAVHVAIITKAIG